MATYKELQDSGSQFIAGAARYSDKFLGVVQQRCNDAGIGLTLAPAWRSRKDPTPVMRGTIVFGNAWKGTRPYTLEVFADKSGPNLNVGYQLVSEEMGGRLSNTELGMRVAHGQTQIHNDPNTQRQLTGILQGFYQLAFVPTVQDLIAAIGAARQQANGFLGA